MTPSPTRRTFLGSSLAGLAATAAAPAASANEKLVVGIMGIGWRGGDMSKLWPTMPNVEVAYVCDVDEARAAKGVELVEKAGKPKPKAVGDFRRMLDDKAVDVLVCTTPNHWHAAATILACSAGKHVYVEKPCSHNPREGELMVAAARRYNRTVQMGNQRRSWPKIQEAVQQLRDGVIGRAYFAQAWYTNERQSLGKAEPSNPPKGLDFELWQGPAARRPYRSNILHYNWHWFWNWGNGELGNNGVHMIDVCRWGLGVDFPSLATSAGGRYRWQDDQETPDTHVATFNFPGGKTITWEGFSCNRIPREKPVDILFQGEKGSLAIQGGGYTVYDPKGKKVSEATGPAKDDLHVGNFIAAVRGSARPNSDIEEGHRTTLLSHLGNISYRTGRTLHCDPGSGKILNDPEAMKLWTREYASGWEPKI